MINSLKKAINDTGSIKARKTLKMFYTNYKMRALHLNFFKSLMSKGYGKVVKGFSSWRNIPVRADNEKIRKCNKYCCFNKWTFYDFLSNSSKTNSSKKEHSEYFNKHRFSEATTLI